MGSAGRSSGNITALLREWSDGRADALPEVLEGVYEELRRIARRHLRRERPDHTLQPTALVHELYLKLAGQNRAAWKSRRHFYAIASKMMRRLLVDHAREREALKRKGIAVTLHEGAALVDAPAVDVLALDRALQKLEAVYPRESQVVELRYFGGMTTEEIAALLGVGVRTVKRDWKFAKSWLLGELERGP